MDKTTRIYVAGHRGLLGSAFLRCLASDGYQNIMVRDRAELDLTDERRVRAFFETAQPQVVVMAAGRVGGILENKSYPADFITSNLRIQLNLMTAAHAVRAERVLFFASSCMYPKECSQPMAERHLLTGRPEETSMPYAISKLAGTEMCLAFNRQFGSVSFIPVIPNNAFGPNDNFDPASSHVLSALIRKFHDAKEAGAEKVTLWGTGTPRREFVHADDIADAGLFLLKADLSAENLPINVGSGTDYAIRELAAIVQSIVGFKGRIEWDETKPDGAPRKLLDCARIRQLGWAGPRILLADGIKSTYEWFCGAAREVVGG
jgi:GDP-L-fucose synthase